jgi:hypothetical protein
MPVTHTGMRQTFGHSRQDKLSVPRLRKFLCLGCASAQGASARQAVALAEAGGLMP